MEPDLKILQKRLAKVRIYPKAKPARNIKALRKKLLLAVNELSEQKMQELKPLLPEAELAGLHLRIAAAVRDVLNI